MKDLSNLKTCQSLFFFLFSSSTLRTRSILMNLSIFFLFLVLIEFVENAKHLDEKIKKINEKGQCVISNIPVPRFRLFNDHLRVKNNPQASNKEATHHVPKTKHRTCTEEPSNKLIHEHALYHCRNNSSKEQEGPPF